MMNWHPEALSIITRLGRQLARNVGKLDEEVIRHLRQRLGVMLVRDNVAMLCARTPTFPPAEFDGEDDSQITFEVLAIKLTNMSMSLIYL